MASIIYLDVDDEITTAAARIRTATDTKVALVLPPGSRLATSRINFRLLSREGLERNRVLSIVAADPAARAIAASAGLPVHATVAEFEQAIAPPPDVGPPPDAGPPPAAEAAGTPKRSRKRNAGAAAAATGAAGAAGAAGDAETAAAPETIGLFDGTPAPAGPPPPPPPVVPPVAAAAVAPAEPWTRVAAAPSTDASPRPEMPPAETRARSSAAAGASVPPVRSGRGMPGGLVAIIGSAIVVLVILAVIGYVVLPSASVVVTPVAVPIGPVDFVVRADPDATSVDAEGGVIPATRLSQDFTASDQFASTGKRVVQVKAKGTLRWTNCDPTRAYTIPAGSIARTGGGIGFATDAGVFLPVAILNPPSITCQNRDVAARALLPGPSGNVGAGTVKVIPPSFNSVVIKVTNPAAMTGGKRDEFPQVSQKDVDAAVAQLGKDLAAQFDAWAAAPDDLPEGTTAFPATGHLGTPVPTPDPATLVGVEQATFQLAATATGTVVAVDTKLIDQVAAGRIAANVPSEHALKDGSVTLKHDGGQADGDLVDFRVTANAAAIPVLDAAVLREQIKGRSVAEAKRLLERYGSVTISTWPGFVSSIPTLDARLDLTVTGLDGASPAPLPSASGP